MTKQDILDYFKDINQAYNNCNMYDSLSSMLDKLLEQKCEICAEKILKEEQITKHPTWVIQKGKKYLHSYRAGRATWTTKGSGVSIWSSKDESTAEFFASAVNGIVVEWEW